MSPEKIIEAIAEQKKPRASLTLLLLSSSAVFCTPAFAQTATDTETHSVSIADIVVTAQKREQNLQSVPVAVTALGSKALEQIKFADVEDLTGVAPGLSVRPGQGGAQIPAFTMRGIYGFNTIGADQGVALYIDGVYVNSAVGASFELADIERVEVLRGPQGTLFGRNSIGGAVSLITRNPPGEFGAKQEFTYGNYNQFRSKTRIDLPAFGPFAASVSYLHNERRGDIRNLGAGTRWDFGPASGGAFGVRTSPRYLGDQNVEAVAASVAFDAGGRIKAVYKFDWTENRYTAPGVGVGTLNPSFSATPTALYFLQPDGTRTPITDQRPDAVNNAFTTGTELKAQSHNLTITWDLVDGITLKNVLGYRKSLLQGSADYGGAGGVLINPAAPATSPLLIFAGSLIKSDERQWSNETQLNISNRWFDFTAGFLYFDVKTISGYNEGVTSQVLQAAVPSSNGYAYTPVPGIVPSFQKITSKGVYMQNELHLLDQLDFVVGGRLSWDRKNGLNSTPTTTAPPVPYNVPFSYNGNEFTYLIGVNYRPTESSLLYAKYSTGYVSGGELFGLAFSPTKAKSWEGGVKADWFDRRLRTNLALFHATYKNLQFLNNGANAEPPRPGGTVIFDQNDARVYGFEFEGTVVPVERLTIQANLSYLDFKYTRVDTRIIGNIDLFKPTRVPDWTGGAVVQYEIPGVWRDGSLLFRADTSYISSNAGAIPLPGFANGGPGYLTGTSFGGVALAGTDAAATVPATWLFNARIGLQDFKVGGVDASLALWAKNLTDNRNRVTSTDFRVFVANQYQPARTYGLDLSLAF